AEQFTAEGSFDDPTLDGYSADIGFCFGITISDENDHIVDTLFFGNVAGRAEKTDINIELHEDPWTDFSYFLDAPDDKWICCFYESAQNADWTLVINNSGTLTLTRLGPTDKVIPDNALSITAADQPGTTHAIADGLSFAVQAGQTWYISYIHTVPKSVTYTFAPGWNLLSLPIVVYDKQPGGTPSWDALLALHPMTLSGNTFVHSDDIACGEAFWVFYTEGQLPDNQLIVSGFEPLRSEWPAPTPGWNFRGTKGEEDNNVYNNIYTWNNEAGLYKPDDATPGSELGFWSR
ncbi:MAG: hypothetical protein GX564_03215, partial [Oligosphaeraceae bacterium]|nr:hypothetical protein [Oligosphaeraceae bacterium]